MATASSRHRELAEEHIQAARCAPGDDAEQHQVLAKLNLNVADNPGAVRELHELDTSPLERLVAAGLATPPTRELADLLAEPVPEGRSLSAPPLADRATSD